MLFAPGKDSVPRGPMLWPKLFLSELYQNCSSFRQYFVAKSPSFPGPNLPGPNLPGPDFPGAQFAKKKSPLGQVCLDPFSKWRGFKLRYWFLSWCLPYSFGILFLNLSLSFPIFSLPPFLTNHKMFPLTLHLSMRHPICLFYPRKTFSQLVSFTGKLILVVDWFYFKYTVFRSTLHGSVDNADQG